MKQAKFYPAIAEFDHILNLDPQNALAYSSRADCLKSLGDEQKASGNVLKALDQYRLAVQGMSVRHLRMKNRGKLLKPMHRGE